MQMYLSIAVTVFLFSYWLLRKRYKVHSLRLPANMETGDVIHSAFGSLLANLSIHGMHIDVMAGIVLYLAYQVASFLKKSSTISKDIATFTAGYFSTLIVSRIPL